MRLGFLTWVVGLGGARRGEGVEDSEAAVGERGRGRGVHDRVTAGIDHVTCHRGGRGADDRGWNTTEGEQVVHRSNKCFLFSIPLFATYILFLPTAPTPLSVLATFFLFFSYFLRPYI